VEEIDVKVNDVKLFRAFAHLIDHQHEVGNNVAHGRIEADRHNSEPTLASNKAVASKKNKSARPEINRAALPDGSAKTLR
jgi:hypothetical protein